MWSPGSQGIAPSIDLMKESDPTMPDKANGNRDKGLECPICWERLDIVENVPYVLWCGHTVCKNCVIGLPRALRKIRGLPIQLPLLISCPWCKLLSLRLVSNGDHVKLPRRNFFLLWILENVITTSDRSVALQSHSQVVKEQRPDEVKSSVLLYIEGFRSFLHKAYDFLGYAKLTGVMMYLVVIAWQAVYGSVATVVLNVIGIAVALYFIPEFGYANC